MGRSRINLGSGDLAWKEEGVYMAYSLLGHGRLYVHKPAHPSVKALPLCELQRARPCNHLIQLLLDKSMLLLQMKI